MHQMGTKMATYTPFPATSRRPLPQPNSPMLLARTPGAVGQTSDASPSRLVFQEPADTRALPRKVDSKITASIRSQGACTAHSHRGPPCRARCSTSVSVAGPIWESLLSAASSSCTLAGASEAILGFLALGSETCRAGRFTVTGRALAFAGKLNLRATAVRSAWPPCFGMT